MNHINLNRLTAMTTWDNLRRTGKNTSMQKKWNKLKTNKKKKKKIELKNIAQAKWNWTFFVCMFLFLFLFVGFTSYSMCVRHSSSSLSVFFSSQIYKPKILQNYTYRLCDFYKRSHVASVAYERIVLQFNIFYLSQLPHLNVIKTV